MGRNALKSWSIVVVAAALLWVPAVYPQKEVDCKQKDLTKRMSCFYQQGDLDAAVPLSEKVLKTAQNVNSATPESIAAAHFNVALLRKRRFQRNRSSRQELSKRETRKLLKLLEEDSKKSEEHFRKVLELRKGAEEVSQVADARYELAWLLVNDTRKSAEDIEKRSAEAEVFYKLALDHREAKLGKDHNQTLSTIFALAECYRNQLKFEEALPYYERYVSTIDTKYGKNQKAVAPALNRMSEIYFTIFEEDKSKSLGDRASALIGSPIIAPKANYVLNNRMTDLQKKKNGRVDTYISLNAINKSQRWDDRHNRFAKEKMKRIPIRVVIDEDGRVSEAVSEAKDEALSPEAVREVRKWDFRPVEVNGVKHKMRGIVVFTKWVVL
ncbi:MAG: tetratricopeptide repeat protein [Pyrinomonadaceae bacterium]|nr:tetratricopeptide repeat protein [Pyrinomonadaceae bacterium]